MKRLGPVDLASFAVYAVMLAYALVTGPRDALWFVGIAVSVVCCAAWAFARLQLGDSFSVGAEAKHLVTTGLYSRLRHPIYVFGTLAFLATLLAWMGWRALVIWAIVGGIQVLRARREDAVLAEKFGDEYRAWRAATWF